MIPFSERVVLGLKMLWKPPEEFRMHAIFIHIFAVSGRTHCILRMPKNVYQDHFCMQMHVDSDLYETFLGPLHARFIHFLFWKWFWTRRATLQLLPSDSTCNQVLWWMPLCGCHADVILSCGLQVMKVALNRGMCCQLAARWHSKFQCLGMVPLFLTTLTCTIRIHISFAAMDGAVAKAFEAVLRGQGSAPPLPPPDGPPDDLLEHVEHGDAEDADVPSADSSKFLALGLWDFRGYFWEFTMFCEVCCLMQALFVSGTCRPRSLKKTHLLCQHRWKSSRSGN